MGKHTINFTLIKDFKLSDKAVFAYVAILMTYQLRKYQVLSPMAMVKNIFGPEATKIKILRQGIEELVEKEVIKISYQENRTILYDLTLLEKYNREIYLVSENTFFEHFSDLSISVCNLYRLYSMIEHLINGKKKKGENVLKTHKRSLASDVQCERHIIMDRLKKLEELGFINYQDYSNDPTLVFQKKQTLFISFPENKDETVRNLEESLDFVPENKTVEDDPTQSVQNYESEEAELAAKNEEAQRKHEDLMKRTNSKPKPKRRSMNEILGTPDAKPDRVIYGQEMREKRRIIAEREKAEAQAISSQVNSDQVDEKEPWKNLRFGNETENGIDQSAEDSKPEETSENPPLENKEATPDSGSNQTSSEEDDFEF